MNIQINQIVTIKANKGEKTGLITEINGDEVTVMTANHPHFQAFETITRADVIEVVEEAPGTEPVEKKTDAELMDEIGILIGDEVFSIVDKIRTIGSKITDPKLKEMVECQVSILSNAVSHIDEITIY